MAEHRTLSHNSFEVHLATNFVFQIQLLLRELVFQFGDLAIGHAILDGDCHLPRRAHQELNIIRTDGVLDSAGERQHTERPASANQGQSATRLESFSTSFRRLLRSHLLAHDTQNERLASLEYPA